MRSTRLPSKGPSKGPLDPPRASTAGQSSSALTRLLAAVTVVALCAAVRPAAAEGGATDREARHRFDEAEAQYKAGHYAEALVKYQAGYAARPLPGFLINIAQCQRRLGDLKAARATYHQFILVAPDSRLVPEVQTLIRQLDDVIAEMPAGRDAPAAEVATQDDVHASDPVAPAAPPALAATPPPPPAAAAPVLIAAPTAPEPAAAPRRSRARWWIWGGIAAAAIAGGIVAGLALSSPETTTIHAGTLGTISR
jgi:tetratricopeptide (TPR) repeat protein